MAVPACKRLGCPIPYKRLGCHSACKGLGCPCQCKRLGCPQDNPISYMGGQPPPPPILHGLNVTTHVDDRFEVLDPGATIKLTATCSKNVNAAYHW